MVAAGPRAKEGHYTSEAPPIRCNTVLRLVCCWPPTHSRLSRDKRAGVPPLRWLSLGIRRSTGSCDARAPRHDGCGRSIRHRRPLRQREAYYSVQDRAATCLLRPPTHIRLSRDKRAGAPPLRWLSLGMRRSTGSCDARAPRRDGCGRSIHHRRPLHQREASHSVQDRAATSPQRPRTHSRLLRDKRTGAPLRWRSLRRRRSTRACGARAPSCKGCDRSTQY